MKNLDKSLVISWIVMVILGIVWVIQKRFDWYSGTAETLAYVRLVLYMIAFLFYLFSRTKRHLAGVGLLLAFAITIYWILGEAFVYMIFIGNTPAPGDLR
jgi:hypothetical protein